MEMTDDKDTWWETKRKRDREIDREKWKRHGRISIQWKFLELDYFISRPVIPSLNCFHSIINNPIATVWVNTQPFLIRYSSYTFTFLSLPFHLLLSDSQSLFHSIPLWFLTPPMVLTLYHFASLSPLPLTPLSETKNHLSPFSSMYPLSWAQSLGGKCILYILFLTIKINVKYKFYCA